MWHPIPNVCLELPMVLGFSTVFTLKLFRLFYGHEIAVSELKILLMSGINLYGLK